MQVTFYQSVASLPPSRSFTLSLLRFWYETFWRKPYSLYFACIRSRDGWHRIYEQLLTMTLNTAVFQDATRLPHTKDSVADLPGSATTNEIKLIERTLSYLCDKI